MQTNLFAYTQPTSDYPGYVSINSYDGKHFLTARSKGEGGRNVAAVEVPESDLLAMADAIISKLRPGSSPTSE